MDTEGSGGRTDRPVVFLPPLPPAERVGRAELVLLVRVPALEVVPAPVRARVQPVGQLARPLLTQGSLLPVQTVLALRLQRHGLLRRKGETCHCRGCRSQARKSRPTLRHTQRLLIRSGAIQSYSISYLWHTEYRYNLVRSPLTDTQSTGAFWFPHHGLERRVFESSGNVQHIKSTHSIKQPSDY